MRIGTATELGLTLRDRRRRLGLSQASLAQEVGVSRQWIVEVEGGKPRVELALVLRVIRALGLELRADVALPVELPPELDIDAIIERARQA